MIALLHTMKQALFPSAILLLHLGAAVEAVLRGNFLWALYFSGGFILTLSILLMGVQK